MNNFLSYIESFFLNLKQGVKKQKENIQQKENRKEERFDVNIDDVKNAHESIPKKLSMYILAVGLITVIAMTFMTVHQQVIAVDKRQKVADTNKTKSPEVQISVDDQSWKHFQNKKIETVSKNTKKQIDTAVNDFKKISKNTTEEIKNELKNTQEFVKSSIGDINKKFNDKLLNIQTAVSQQLKANVKNVHEEIAKSTEKSNSTNSGYEQLNNSSILLPPPLASLNNSGKNKKLNTEVKVKKIEQEDEYDEYDDVQIDNVEVQTDNITTSLYKNTIIKKKKILPYHIMQGLTNATLLTGVNAPTFGSKANDRTPVLLSIDGDTLIANEDESILANCLVTGSAQGNVNTSRADVLLTGISCSGRDKKGNTVKIEQAIKGWVMGEDGAMGLQGRLVDSSGKVITKMIAISLIKGMTAAAIAAAQPANTLSGGLTGGVNPMINAQTQAANGLGNGFKGGLQQVQNHYNQILTGMYPTISVRAGKKVSILFKGGEDVKPKIYKNVDIYDDLMVDTSTGVKK